MKKPWWDYLNDWDAVEPEQRPDTSDKELCSKCNRLPVNCCGMCSTCYKRKRREKALAKNPNLCRACLKREHTNGVSCDYCRLQSGKSKHARLMAVR
jgi:hypothetical protein